MGRFYDRFWAPFSDWSMHPPRVFSKNSLNSISTLTDPGKTRVIVAGGGMIGVSAKVNQFTWLFRDQEFKTDLMVIPLSLVIWS
uniref:Gag-pol protein n=1 Tax=Boechera divaricarpa TaxID=115915 RepID=B6REK3_9BRAS|nr:gag-pol protein [Boechera divaricarpa]